jgi:dihydroflavonol-4-reductase
MGDWLEKLGKKGPLNSETASTATLYHWFDNSKAKKILNLKQRPAREAIFESVNWMKENKII